MAHFPQNTAIGACDALNGPYAAVGVIAHIQCGRPVKVYILGGNLPVFAQFCQHLIAGHKAALAVADGNGVHIARL